MGLPEAGNGGLQGGPGPLAPRSGLSPRAEAEPGGKQLPPTTGPQAKGSGVGGPGLAAFLAVPEAHGGTAPRPRVGAATGDVHQAALWSGPRSSTSTLTSPFSA